MAKKRKVYFYPVPGRAADMAALKAAVVALDCTEEATDASEAEVIVVLICAETVADAGLDGAIEGAADGRFRALGVYAGDSDGTIPTALEDYASGFVPINVDKLRAALCDEAALWDDPTGCPRPEPDTPRRCS